VATVRILLVRHGESEVNADPRRIYRGANVWSELRCLARYRARMLGRNWKRAGRQVDWWISSPAIRAQQSCSLCQKGFDVMWPSYELADDIVELRQGEAEGKSRDLYRFGAVMVAGGPLVFPHTDEEFWTAKLHSPSCEPVPGAESQAEVFQRAKRFLEMRSESLADRSGDQVVTVAVFTHENVIKCLLRGLELCARSYVDIKVRHLSETTLEYTNGKWRLDRDVSCGDSL
jgi:broad specificity phosphatase PhoE